MFLLKIYDNLHGNLKKIYTKEITEVSNADKQINWSSTDIDVKLFITDGSILNIGDYFVLYNDYDVIFNGFIYEKEIVIDAVGKSYTIRWIQSFYFLSNFTHNGYSWNARTKIQEILADINTATGVNNYLTLDNINNVPNIDITSTVAGNFTEILKSFFSKVNLDFYIDANNQICTTGKNHKLIFGKEVENIQINTTNSNIIKNDNIKNSIVIYVNNLYNIQDIQPIDTITILNIQDIQIRGVKIAKITNSWQRLKIQLLNSDSFTNLIKSL